MNGSLFSNLYWELPIVLTMICLVYSATRYDDWGSILHEALRWGLRMAGFLLSIGAALYVVALWL